MQYHLYNKKVMVVGLKRSGIAAAKLLLEKGAKVYATELREESVRLDGVILEIGRHTRNFVEGKELVVISPGVPPQCPVINWAKELAVPVISELELASWFTKSPLVAVTGTNGKSTVTSLIEHILRWSGKKVAACGNIGIPLSEIVLQKRRLELLVLEVSSFQLEYIQSFRPNTAVWLNFSCDHMDHHSSMEEYLQAKLNIFKNQKPGDWAVIYSGELERVKNMVKGKIVVYNKEEWAVPYGNVFPENILAAAVVAGIYGVKREMIQDAVKTFKPLPHRLQYVATINGVSFIDDSKATNVHSVLGALSNIAGPLVLILGGRDKGDDFTLLRKPILEKVSSIVVTGEAKEKIYNQLKGFVPIEKVHDFCDSIRYAKKIARPGEKVLLSPGCASFDIFKNYEERGDEFRRCVEELDTVGAC